MNITRINPPSWARELSIENDGLADEAFASLRAAREAMLDSVHAEVSEYLSDPGLVFDSPDEFPSTQRLTGDYYISREHYHLADELGCWRVAVMTRFLEHPFPGQPVPGDYLGLEVWLETRPGNPSFFVFRNTDSSSI